MAHCRWEKDCPAAALLTVNIHYQIITLADYRIGKDILSFS
jgi:hypothetical protein